MGTIATHFSCSFSPQMDKPPETPGKDDTRTEGMEETKTTPELTNPPPGWRNQPPPAAALSSRFVPVIAHPAGRPLGSLEFVFYRREWPNSLAPFCTAQKAVCGCRFQESARHGRHRLDLQSSEPGKWRPFCRRKP